MMSRRHSRSPPSPGDPGPSSMFSRRAASAVGPSKRKRSSSRDTGNPVQGRRGVAQAVSPRRRSQLEDTGQASQEWTYHLEIIQQPQRARACGFGDKDRRPLSPPPILRLWVRDAAGRLVDPNHVSIQFMVLMVDLWSADGDRQKNVVMHPASQGSSRADSPSRTTSDQTSRPGTGHSSAWPGPPYRMTPGTQHPSVLSPLMSPHTSRPPHELPPNTGWQSGPQHATPSRPATMRGRSYTRPAPSHMDPPRPTTAPSSRHTAEQSMTTHRPTLPVASQASYPLPPISSITLLDREEAGVPSRLTLPALHDRPTTRDTQSSTSSAHHDFYHPFGRPTSSSSTGGPWFSSSTGSTTDARHQGSMSSVASEVLTPLREQGPPFERPLTGNTAMDRPMTGYGSDRPPSSSYDYRPFTSGPGPHEKYPPTTYHWERPTTSGGHVTFDPLSRDIDTAGPQSKDPRSVYLSPRQTDQHRLSNASSTVVPQPNYSRVLVGSLCAVCQRLQDEDGQTGLFFFAHDLGIRTEGTFTLKFTLTDLTSLMQQSVMPGSKVRVLAEAYSAPFTVFSAKRFPGVIPTTELTRHFAKQGVRLPTRQKRAVAGDSDNEGDGDDD